MQSAPGRSGPPMDLATGVLHGRPYVSPR
jgi:hypothetical protein